MSEKLPPRRGGSEALVVLYSIQLEYHLNIFDVNNIYFANCYSHENKLAALAVSEQSTKASHIHPWICVSADWRSNVIAKGQPRHLARIMIFHTSEYCENTDLLSYVLIWLWSWSFVHDSGVKDHRVRASIGKKHKCHRKL